MVYFFQLDYTNHMDLLKGKSAEVTLFCLMG